MPVSEKTYERVALEDPEGAWELHDGRLRQKPGMSFEHNHAQAELFLTLANQLDRREFVVRMVGRVRRSPRNYYIPDVVLVPAHLARAGRRERPNRLEMYDEPLPLVVEIWSPSTGDYDVEEKLPEYQRRGDREIWRIQPYERTATAWRRQPDGSYEETLYRRGTIEPVGLPGVVADLDRLFADA